MTRAVPGHRGPAVLVEVTRRDAASGRELVESVHHGHLVVVDGDGGIVVAAGDPDTTVLPRSAVKPFQAAACLELLGDDATSLSQEEVAVAWASHRAEPAQLAAVRRLLARSGTAEESLSCPTAVPPDEPGAPASRVACNCSGKHALFALTAQRNGLPRDPSALLAPDGPLQSRVLAHMAAMIGPPRAVAVDGCGAPAVAVPLVVLARAFTALAAEARFAQVRAAGLTHPALIGGHEPRTDGPHPVVDTALLSVGIVAKRGAEGVLAAGWRLRDGSVGGAAVKASDGSMRGAATALVATLEDRGVVPRGTWMEAVPLGGAVPAGSVRPAGPLGTS
jgi:L-asparaginase II